MTRAEKALQMLAREGVNSVSESLLIEYYCPHEFDLAPEEGCPGDKYCDECWGMQVSQ